jgi:DNA-binding MarR family transcriptional regulator
LRRGAPARRPRGTAERSSRGTTSETAAVRAWVRILAVHKRAIATLRDHLDTDMTLPRFDLLANLVRNDGQTLAALSRSMLVTAGNLTGLVDRAARDGMVERRADPSDRRAWRVHITTKGQRAFRDAERRHAARVSRIFAGFSGPELQTLTRLLDKLKDDLHAPASVGRRAAVFAVGASIPPPGATSRGHADRAPRASRRKTAGKTPKPS